MVKVILFSIIYSFISVGSTINDSIHWMNSATSSAIGTATTAKTNSTDALFFNAAGLMKNKKSSLSVNYTSTYHTNFSTFGFIAKNNTLSFGIGIHHNQSNSIEKTSINQHGDIVIDGSFKYSFSSLYISSAFNVPFIKDWAKIGTSLHLNQMKIDKDTLKGTSINLSVLLTPVSFLSLGYTQHNIMPLRFKWTNKVNENLSTIHHIKSFGTAGIESKIINKKTFKWSILADYDIGKNNQSPTYSPLKIGSEIHINPITILGGFNHRFMSFGASTNINHFKITYAFILPNEQEMLENRHAIGLTYFLK